MGMISIDCECCELRQRIGDRDGPIPPVCDTCHEHRGRLPEKLLARAQSHEAMLRQRLDACRGSEERAQRDKERMKERMVSALNSRGALAARLVDDPDNAHRLATDSRVVAWAERHKNPDGYEDAASEFEDDAGWSYYPAQRRLRS